MTALTDRETERATPDATDPRPAPPAPSRVASTSRAGSVGPLVALSMMLTAVLLLGFGAYLLMFSGLSEQRAQHALRQQFTDQLANAVAPVGPTHEGAPVAVLDAPEIGVHDLVVVEGTSSRDLMSGPGHLPATPLPGQAGTSTIYGKRWTFGSPFRSLLSLKIGDRIRVTTGQGVQTYRVSSFGDTEHPAPANSDNRLQLLTAENSWSPDRVVVVSADLISTVQPSSGALPPAADEQKPLHRAVDASIVPLAGWSQVLLLTAIVGTFAMSRWPRWPVVLCLGPVTAAVVWCVYENAAGLLPNVL